MFIGAVALVAAALNPARTLGTVLYIGDLAKPTTYLMYLAGPIIGSALAMGVLKFMNSGEAAEQTVKKPPKKK